MYGHEAQRQHDTADWESLTATCDLWLGAIWLSIVHDMAAALQAVPLLVFNLKGLSGAAADLVERVRGALDPKGTMLTTCLDLNTATDIATTVANFLQVTDALCAL